MAEMNFTSFSLPIRLLLASAMQPVKHMTKHWGRKGRKQEKQILLVLLPRSLLCAKQEVDVVFSQLLSVVELEGTEALGNSKE